MLGRELGRSVGPWLRLGFRLTVGGGRRALARAALLGLGAAAGIVLVLSALALPIVVDAQTGRAAARSPVPATPGSATALRMVAVRDAIDKRPLLRVNVSGATQQSPVPPGVDRLPSPGEIVISPALLELMQENPFARNRFPQRMIGLVDEAGLVAPDELVAYVGLDASRMPESASAVSAFGGLSRSDDTATRLGTAPMERLLTPGRVAAFAFAFFLLAPLAVLLSTCARLSATARDQRLASLRLLGASTRQAQIVNAVETGLVALVGVIVGNAAFPGLARTSDMWSIGRFHHFGTDVVISPITKVVASSIIVLFAVIVGAVSAVPAISQPLPARREGTTGEPQKSRLFVFGSAVLTMLASTLTGAWPTISLSLFALGAIATAATLSLALPSIVYTLSATLLRWTTSPVWLRLMLRRVMQSPTAMPRLVAALAVAVFVGGVALIAITSYGNEHSSERIAKAGYLPQQLTGDRDVARQLAARVGPQDLAFYEYLGANLRGDGSRPVAVIRGRCHDLTVLFGTATHCRDGAVYRVKGSGDDLPVGHALIPADPLYNSVAAYRVPAPIIELGESAFGQQADVVITEAPSSGQISVKVGATSDALGQWYADVAAIAPTAEVQGFRDVPRGFDAGAVVALVGAGLIVAIIMGLVSFIIAAVDRAMASRRLNVPLIIIGTPARVIRVADAGQSLLAVATGLGLALGLTIITTWAWSEAFDTPRAALAPSVIPLLALVLGGLVLGVVTAVAATTSTGRSTPELLRRE